MLSWSDLRHTGGQQQEARATAEDGSAAVKALICKTELLDDHNGDHQGGRGRLAATKGRLKPPAEKRRSARVASAAFWERLVYNQRKFLVLPHHPRSLSLPLPFSPLLPSSLSRPPVDAAAFQHSPALVHHIAQGDA